ncbi:hypothetical protein BLOT_012573 [Blomia tropicalis]|nr:hypothetical protein BLOT_012573 [Blomia tropicalis]
MNKSPEGRYLFRYVSARVVFVAMGFLGFNLVYAYKVVLSMSIIAMTNHTGSNVNSSDCIANEVNKTSTTTFPGEKFDWDSDVQSQVLSSFFYGYILTQIPAGILATKYGGKWIYGTSLFIAAIFSILGPIAAKVDYRLFMVTRIIQGLAEGVVFPCMNTLIAQWMPKMERTRGTTIIQTGSMIGTVITLPLTALMCKSNFMGSWPATFYILGVAGIIWYALWIVLVYESPETHPFISKAEMDYILENDGGFKLKENLSIPYKEMFTSIPVIALTLTHFGQNWGFLTVLNLMPTYMNNVLHMQINENMLISGLPYLGQAIFGWIISYITDKIRQSGRVEITTLRKINCFIAYMPPAICLALIPTARCDTTYSSILFILAMTFNGACFSGMNSTHVDMAPDHAGTLMGITNSFGNIPGFLATIVANQFTGKGQTIHNWSYVFYLSAGVFVANTFIYGIFASAREQSWGRTPKKQ